MRQSDQLKYVTMISVHTTETKYSLFEGIVMSSYAAEKAFGMNNRGQKANSEWWTSDIETTGR